MQWFEQSHLRWCVYIRMKTHARTHARAMFPEGDGRSEGGGSLEDCNGSVTTTADLDKPEKLFCNTTPKDPLGGEEWEVIFQAKSHLCTKAGDSTRPFFYRKCHSGGKKKNGGVSKNLLLKDERAAACFARRPTIDAANGRGRALRNSKRATGEKKKKEKIRREKNG